MNEAGRQSVDYLVGGFRISIGPESTTPGPRTHIVAFVEALRQSGTRVRTVLASDLPFLSRFARVQQSDYVGAAGWKIHAADVVRVGAAIWSGMCVFALSATAPAPSVIYERVAVLQSLSSFHRFKRRAVRIVEANGVLSRETAQDRKVLRAERLATALERHVLRRADLVVAVSTALKTELVQHAGIAPSKVLVVPNGVSDAFFDAVRVERSSDRVTIGFVGSVVAWQHLDEFLEAVQDVRRARTDGRRIAVEIVGEGGDLARLERMVTDRGWTGSVTFLGRLPHEDALQRMRSWDLGFAGHRRSSSASMYHSPLKLYEYAALGLIVVCTPSADATALAASGASLHTFEERSGLEGALRSALADLDRSTAEEMAERRERVRQSHSWRARTELLMRTVASGETGSAA